MEVLRHRGLDRFQRVSEEEALRMALEESVRVGIQFHTSFITQSLMLDKKNIERLIWLFLSYLP